MNKDNEIKAKKRYRILIAEDNDEDFELFKYNLKQLQEQGDFKFDRVTALKEVKQKLSEADYDLVLLDLFLDDTQTIDQPTKFIQDSTVPIVVMTGLDDNQLGETLVSFGAQDYLIKSDLTPELVRKTILYSIDRFAALQRLLLTEKKFGQLFKQSSDAMVLLNKNGEMIEVNDEFQHLSGITINPSEVTLLQDTIELDDENFNLEEILSGVHDDEVLKFDGKFKVKNKKHILAEFRFSEIDLNDDTLIQLSVRNITEQRQLDELKDAFLSAVSHEMRTPLAIINGALFNLIEGIAGAPSDNQMKLLEMASSNVNRLNKIINNLFDLSRLETTRKSQIVVERLSLHDVFQKLIDRFDEQAKDKNVEIILNVSEDLSSFYVDHKKFETMLMNLMSNSIQHAQSVIKIDVQSSDIKTDLLSQNLSNQNFFFDEDQSKQYNLMISFFNDGEGLQKSELTQLFDKFVQIKRPFGGAGYKGAGLGLAICKEIATLHEGEIWAESDGVHGVVTKIRLPQKADFEYQVEGVFENLISTHSQQSSYLFVLKINKENPGSRGLSKDILKSFFEQTQIQIERKLLLSDDKVIVSRKKNEIIFVKHQNADDFSQFLHSLHDVCYDIWPKGYEFLVGVAQYPVDGMSLESLVETAEKKMIQLRQKPRLLMIDDDKDFIEMITLYLQTKHYSVDLAFNGLSGLEKAKEHLPDMIVLDRIMPELNGVELVRKLRNNPRTKDIPIVIVTAYADAKFNEIMGQYKHLEVVHKPVNPQKLVDLIQNMYQKSILPDVKHSQTVIDNRTV